MRYGRTSLLIVLSIAAVAAVALLASPSAADELVTPSPAPSAAPAAPSPATDDMVAWALRWRTRAVRLWERWNHARDCLGLDCVRFDSPKPARSEPNGVWYEAGREWKHRCPDYRDRFARLWEDMTSPGGSGAERWRPLIRWYWPAALVDKAVWVVARESGGCPTALNRWSGAAGLFQLCPAPDGWSNPAINVRLGYTKYRAAGGWSPWSVCY